MEKIGRRISGADGADREGARGCGQIEGADALITFGILINEPRRHRGWTDPGVTDAQAHITGMGCRIKALQHQLDRDMGRGCGQRHALPGAGVAEEHQRLVIRLEGDVQRERAEALANVDGQGHAHSLRGTPSVSAPFASRAGDPGATVDGR